MRTLKQLTDIKAIMEFRAKAIEVFNTVGDKLVTWKTRKMVFQTYVTKLLTTQYLYSSEGYLAEIIAKDYLDAATNTGLEVVVSKSHTAMLTETEVYFAVVLFKYIWQTITCVSCDGTVTVDDDIVSLVDEYFGIRKDKGDAL